MSGEQYGQQSNLQSTPPERENDEWVDWQPQPPLPQIYRTTNATDINRTVEYGGEPARSADHLYIEWENEEKHPGSSRFQFQRVRNVLNGIKNLISPHRQLQLAHERLELVPNPAEDDYDAMVERAVTNLQAITDTDLTTTKEKAKRKSLYQPKWQEAIFLDRSPEAQRRRRLKNEWAQHGQNFLNYMKRGQELPYVGQVFPKSAESRLSTMREMLDWIDRDARYARMKEAITLLCHGMETGALMAEAIDINRPESLIAELDNTPAEEFTPQQFYVQQVLNYVDGDILYHIQIKDNQALQSFREQVAQLAWGVWETALPLIDRGLADPDIPFLETGLNVSVFLHLKAMLYESNLILKPTDPNLDINKLNQRLLKGEAQALAAMPLEAELLGLFARASQRLHQLYQQVGFNPADQHFASQVTASEYFGYQVLSKTLLAPDSLYLSNPGQGRRVPFVRQPFLTHLMEGKGYQGKTPKLINLEFLISQKEQMLGPVYYAFRKLGLMK